MKETTIVCTVLVIFAFIVRIIIEIIDSRGDRK